MEEKQVEKFGVGFSLVSVSVKWSWV